MNASYSTKAFSRRISALRHERGLSREELAEKANLPQALIVRYEQGLSEPKATTIIALADALDCSLGLLLCRTQLTGVEKSP